MKELSPLTCLRCSEQWTPKVEHPRFCPRCKSPLWNKPYRRGPKKTAVGEKHVIEAIKIENAVAEMSKGLALQVVAEIDVLCDPKPNISYAEQVKLAIERIRR